MKSIKPVYVFIITFFSVSILYFFFTLMIIREIKPNFRLDENKVENRNNSENTDIIEKSDIYEETRTMVPINIKTQGYYDENYRQIGVLTNEDFSKNLPLYGRQVSSSKWNYSTQVVQSHFQELYLSIEYEKKDCSEEFGCNMISSGDIVFVPQMNENFTVKLHNTCYRRYL